MWYVQQECEDVVLTKLPPNPLAWCRYGLAAPEAGTAAQTAAPDGEGFQEGGAEGAPGRRHLSVKERKTMKKQVWFFHTRNEFLRKVIFL